MRLLVVLGIALALVGGCHRGARGKRVRIAAAADLAKAWTELGAAFEQSTGIHPEFTFGSSGMLARQVEQGAPYALLAAANKEYIDKVVKTGVCDGATAQLYGRGRIVAWVPAGKQPPRTFAELADPKYGKIAIANPEHAPYGVAAKQAFERSGLWDTVKNRLVLGENVQATMIFARDGNADIAIIALSLAVVSDGGSFLPVDPALHDPLDQQMIVCGKGAEADAAKQFEAFVNSSAGHEVMTRYGFALPTK